MGRTLAALLVSAALLLTGCADATSGTTEATESTPDEPAQTLELEGMEPEEPEAETGHPINPTGKTDYGFNLGGPFYVVGPVKFNCPTSFGVTKQTENEIELYNLDGAMLRVTVDWDNDEFSKLKNLTEDQIAGVINGGAPDVESSEARWVGSYDDYVTYSAKMTHQNGNTSLTNVVASSGDWKAVLILSAKAATFDEDAIEFEAIADSLRPMK